MDVETTTGGCTLGRRIARGWCRSNCVSPPIGSFEMVACNWPDRRCPTRAVRMSMTFPSSCCLTKPAALQKVRKTQNSRTPAVHCPREPILLGLTNPICLTGNPRLGKTSAGQQVLDSAVNVSRCGKHKNNPCVSTHKGGWPTLSPPSFKPWLPHLSRFPKGGHVELNLRNLPVAVPRRMLAPSATSDITASRIFTFRKPRRACAVAVDRWGNPELE